MVFCFLFRVRDDCPRLLINREKVGEVVQYIYNVSLRL